MRHTFRPTFRGLKLPGCKILPSNFPTRWTGARRHSEELFAHPFQA
jgi:hypothetical protein